MNDNYYELLNANLSQELLENNILKLAEDTRYSNNCFIMPANKMYWENAAKVLAKRGYPIIRDILMELFEWLQDMNWPGAITVVNILNTIPKKVLVENLEKTIEIALEENNGIWLNWLYVFIHYKVVGTDDFNNKELFNILNSHSEHFI